MIVVCWLLRVGYCLLFAVRGLLTAVCCLRLLSVCCLMVVVCGLLNLFVGCCRC